MTATRPDAYYDIHIFVCTFVRPGESARRCCGASGAERLLAYLRARTKEIGIAGLRVNAAGCLSPDCCNLGPTLVIYPEGVWYKYQTEADLDDIVSEHLLQGRPVERLRLKPFHDAGAIEKLSKKC